MLTPKKYVIICFFGLMIVAFYAMRLNAQIGVNADGRLEIFALGSDKAAWHKWQSTPNGSWGEWSSLGGTALQQIITANNADGRMEVFALGGDNGVWHAWQSSPNGGWGGWSSLGGSKLEQIAVAINADGRLEVFALGGDKAVWHKWQSTPNGGWGEWSSLGGTDLQQIVVGKNADGRLEVFALGGDNGIWHVWQSAPNGGWGGWSTLGGSDLRQVAVANNADGRLEVFALGGDKAVWHKWQSVPNGGFGEWSSMGGTNLQQINLAKNADGRLEVFALGGNKGAWHIWQSAPNGGWGQWFSLGGTELQQIAVGRDADGRLEAFALGGDKGIWHTWQSVPNGGFGQWFSLGGTDLRQIADISFSDRDNDGISDRDEQKLLERFRPYYKFSLAPGEEDEHPADAKWFVQHSELYDHHTESGTPVLGIETLRQSPSTILNATTIGPSDIRQKRDKSDYYLNLNNDFRGGDPDWNHIKSAAVGIYGHVAPLNEDPNRPANITAYKIEYWQFYAHDNAGGGVASIHEGDWEAVQLIIERDRNSIRTVMHNVHNMQVRFNMATGNRVDIGNNFIEYQGPKMERGFIDYNTNGSAAQNNLVRFYCESGECTHPVVYIEHGGHASWPTQYGWWPGVDNHDGNSYSYLVATPANLGEIGYPNPYCPGADLVLYFNGHWGAYGDGPEGPTVKKDQWGKK